MQIRPQNRLKQEGNTQTTPKRLLLCMVVWLLVRQSLPSLALGLRSYSWSSESYGQVLEAVHSADHTAHL